MSGKCLPSQLSCRNFFFSFHLPFKWPRVSGYNGANRVVADTPESRSGPSVQQIPPCAAQLSTASTKKCGGLSGQTATHASSNAIRAASPPALRDRINIASRYYSMYTWISIRSQCLSIFGARIRIAINHCARTNGRVVVRNTFLIVRLAEDAI